MAEIISLDEYKWSKQKPLDNVETMGCYGCMGVAENCINPGSFGVLCVLCNGCGRFEDEDGM